MVKVIDKKVKLVKVGFFIPEEKHRALKIKSATEGLSIKDIFNKFVEEYLQEKQKKS